MQPPRPITGSARRKPKDVISLNDEREATVLVAVRAPQVREALAAIIGSFEGFTVVGEADCEDQALELARSFRPTIAIVDDDLPGCCGPRAMQTMHQESLVGAIVATGLRSSGVTRARAAGAETYIQTGAPPDDLVEALQAAVAASRHLTTIPTSLSA